MSSFLFRMVKRQTDKHTTTDSSADQFSYQQTFGKQVSSFQCAESESRPLEGI